MSLARYHHHPWAADKFQLEVEVIHLANSIANTIEIPFSLDDDSAIHENICLQLNYSDEIVAKITTISKEVYLDTINLIYSNKAA